MITTSRDRALMRPVTVSVQQEPGWMETKSDARLLQLDRDMRLETKGMRETVERSIDMAFNVKELPRRRGMVAMVALSHHHSEQ